jgi:hypothetical protein
VGRSDYQWDQLRTKFYDYCRRSNALCHICVARGDAEHAVIDYRAKPLSPTAFEADHYHTWHDHPELRYEWANLRASHSRCNRQRRNERMEVTAPQHDWVKPDW